MLANIPMIPYLLVVTIDVPGLDSDLKLEHVYNLNKTTVVFSLSKEPLQTTQYTATVICQLHSSDSIRCLLHNIDIVSTLTYHDFNTTREITKKQRLNSEDWFRIEFKDGGVRKIFVNETTNKKDIIVEIAKQFELGDNLNLISFYYDGRTTRYMSFTETERLIGGTCSTTYNISSIHEEKDVNKENSKYHISLSEYYYNKKNIRIRIEKDRKDCHFSSSADFFNIMKMIKYVHTMEVFDDKFNMSTILEMQSPFVSWSSALFRETTLLNLINILPYQQYYPANISSYYTWIEIDAL